VGCSGWVASGVGCAQVGPTCARGLVDGLRAGETVTRPTCADGLRAGGSHPRGLGEWVARGWDPPARDWVDGLRAGRTHSRGVGWMAYVRVLLQADKGLRPASTFSL